MSKKIIRLSANPEGFGSISDELDSNLFVEKPVVQHTHLYYQDEDLGLFVGVWDTTDMIEAAGPYAYFWLVAVIPVALYPFFGGKVWCRMWCPLAKYMQVLSKWYGTLQISSNEKCISCTQCSTYCQVGVDVMAFAKNGQAFDNTNTSCIHCGICITVCPMDVLSFDNDARKEKVVKDVPLS